MLLLSQDFRCGSLATGDYTPNLIRPSRLFFLFRPSRGGGPGNPGLKLVAGNCNAPTAPVVPLRLYLIDKAVEGGYLSVCKPGSPT
jgi:hypothetical protein